MNSRTSFKFVPEEHQSGDKRKLYKTLEESFSVTKSYKKAWYTTIKGRKAQANFSDPHRKSMK